MSLLEGMAVGKEPLIQFYVLPKVKLKHIPQNQDFDQSYTHIIKHGYNTTGLRAMDFVASEAWNLQIFQPEKTLKIS